MKLHTNNSDAVETLTQALQSAKRAGRVQSGIYFDLLEPANSRSHSSAASFHIVTSRKDAGERRYRPGFGQSDRDNYAATYDEYGWLMVEIFALDPSASFGRSVYADRADFDRKTNYRFVSASV